MTTLMLSLFAGFASAALPTEATDAITAISSDGTDLIAAVWPVIALVVGAGIVIKLFKRFTGKV